ncbi:hypothetical protein [Mesorhizobium onobrychidis]|uniref:Uncharacterized protein n=1 Tax=Mesorhizobium onobrychidis TaxID=2775404 RepID=A0ABY5QX28_9HYPH|nr:hypothetical protein [Mesorhizobium onobrychidis]UVC15266.1 hypothetical protein IHQ72_32800 [Mesorhizobium onobrychidis]
MKIVFCVLTLSATLPVGRPHQGQKLAPFFRSPVELERLVDDVLACGELKAEALGIDARHDVMRRCRTGSHSSGIARMARAFLAARSTGKARPKPDKLVRFIQPPSGTVRGFSHINALTAR